MKKTFLSGLLALCSALVLHAGENPVLQVRTTSTTESVPIVSVVSIAFDGEETMVLRTVDQTLRYSLSEVEMISIAEGVTALVHLTADKSDGVVRLFDPAGRLLRQVSTMQQVREELSTRPAGIYLIEVDGKTSKLLKQ
jgi:hypothetical protein